MRCERSTERSESSSAFGAHSRRARFFFILMYIYEVQEEHGAERELKRFFLFLEIKKLGSISIVGARRARSGARAQALLAHTGCARARYSEESRATPGEGEKK